MPLLAHRGKVVRYQFKFDLSVVSHKPQRYSSAGSVRQKVAQFVQLSCCDRIIVYFKKNITLEDTRFLSGGTENNLAYK